MNLIKKSVYIEKAPAKINLFLDVLDKRKDGYHNLKTVFQAIELSDHITLEIRIETGDDDEVDFEVSIDSNNEEIKMLGSGNIVAKAIEVFFSELPDSIINLLGKVFIEVFIDKQIPVNAGLAGGSADAGAVLRILNTFFNQNFDLGLSENEILKIAAKIGADVPFCYLSINKPRLYAESLGEDFKETKIDYPFDDYKRQVIIKPDFDIVTAEAYSWLDSYSKAESKAKTESHDINDGFYNSFEYAVGEMHPEIKAIKNGLKDIGCDFNLLSGSGSCVVGFVHNDKDFDKILSLAREFFSNYKILNSEYVNVFS